MISDNIAYNYVVVLDITLSINTTAINMYTMLTLLQLFSAGSSCGSNQRRQLLRGQAERAHEHHRATAPRRLRYSRHYPIGYMYIVGVLCTTNTNPRTHRLTTP